MKTKVVGVTHDNPDGTNRQDILRWMKEHGYEKGDILDFVREKDNPVDPNAVMVLNNRKQCIGYLNAKLAAPIAAMIDDGLGKHLYAELLNITGGTPSRPTLGCNIEIPMAEWNYNDTEGDKPYTVQQKAGCFTLLAATFIFTICLIWVLS